MKTIAHARIAFNHIVDDTKRLHGHISKSYTIEETAAKVCSEAPLDRLMLALLYAAVNDGHEWQMEPCPTTGTIGEAIALELAEYIEMVVEGDLEQ